jgi:hypothetical protein
MRVSKKALQDLRITGLDTERSHAIAGALVRIYFQLSEPPPLGWSYIFTTVWQAVAYPLKRQAGMEGDAIWIDCIPEEIGTYHIKQLESAVAQANAKYRDGARQQRLKTNRQAELDVQLRSRLEDLSRTLYPVGELAGSSGAAQRFLGSAFLAKLRRFLFQDNKQENDV